MSTQIIMVQIADRPWTVDAIHSACKLARQINGQLVLMSMIPVQHLSYLGTEFGYLNVTDAMRSAMHEYASTAEDYGVPFSTQRFQYVTLLEAIVQAANEVNAQLVFATLPQSIIPYWRKFQQTRLRHQLQHHHRVLIDLEQTAEIQATFAASTDPVSTIRASAHHS
jgi:hypothetical protein